VSIVDRGSGGASVEMVEITSPRESAFPTISPGSFVQNDQATVHIPDKLTTNIMCVLPSYYGYGFMSRCL
jgi:hypothetical protein